MKIVSKFHDFYDPIMKIFYDPEILYIRKTESKGIRSHDIFPILSRYWRERKTLYRQTIYNSLNQRIFEIEGMLICFCGKTYPVCRVKDLSVYLSPYKYFYEQDLQKLVNIIQKDRTAKLRERDLKEFFNVSRDCSVVNREFNSPVVLFRCDDRYEDLRYEVVTNPCLRELDFQRIVDPYTAFQELFMWAGMNQNPNPMYKLSDKEKILKAGFDLKKSFRKEKAS